MTDMTLTSGPLKDTDSLIALFSEALEFYEITASYLALCVCMIHPYLLVVVSVFVCV